MIDTGLMPGAKLVFEPLTTARTARDREKSREVGIDAEEIGQHCSARLFHYHFTRKPVHVNAAVAQEMDSVMPIEKRTVGTCLQTVG